MLISAIVAMSEDGVIGVNNELPWHLRDDMLNFKAVTLGKPIIMGRKTFDSIGHPLPGRSNIVLSRDPKVRLPGCSMVPSFDRAMKAAQEEGAEEVVIIGGAEIYATSLPFLSRLYLTLVSCRLPGDAWFPYIEWNDWKVVSERAFAKNEQNDFSFSVVRLDRVTFDNFGL